MNLEYKEFVAKLFKTQGYVEKGKYPILHAAVGISTEAGELLDAAKKAAFHDHNLDRANIVEELGDLLFYIQGLANVLDLEISDILINNMDKLEKRYPAGYNDADSKLRRDKQ